MKLSGYCTQQTLVEAIQQALTDSRVTAKILLDIGFLDSTTLNTFVYCQALVGRRFLRTEQVLYVLNSIRNRNLTLDEALSEFGVSTSSLG
jgi:hypothetical protein